MEKKSQAKTLSLSGNKLGWHLSELEKWRNGEMFPPIYIEFGPTSICNHKCLHCYVQNAVVKPISMKNNIYLKFMEEIGDYGVKAIVLGGCGEPMMHPKTGEAIGLAVEHGTDVGMLTNGVPIREKDIPNLMDKLTYARFSINGGSRESYSKVHRCKPEDWDKVLGNMENCVNYRERNNSKCTLGAYTLLSDYNIDEMESWTKRVKNIGFDYMIIKPPAKGLDRVEFVKQAELDKTLPVLKKLEELSDDKFKVEVRMDLFEDKGSCEREYGKCLGLPFMCAVDADGSVYACNWYWGNKDFCYGNLNDNSFKDIWEGERKKEIIARVEGDNFDFGKCGECRQNSINKFLWQFANPPRHINFI